MKTKLQLVTVLALAAPTAVFAQGPLTPPPGAPAPTMKTLDQLEARTPVSIAPFTISASGSYYLTGNLAVTSGSAITINADNVTLDLNGFTISSTASPAVGTAVPLSGIRRNVTVKNGHIRGTTTFAAGTFTTGGFLDGIHNQSVASANLRVANVNVSSVGSSGINFFISIPSSRHMVERCTVSICGGIGIRAGRVGDCSVDTAGGAAIMGDVVSNSSGQSVGTTAADQGVSGSSVVENCRGLAVAGIGVFGEGQVSNSFGTSTSGPGLVADCAHNCQGVSTSDIGLVAFASALNCSGSSTSGSSGISVTGTASFCRGRRAGGVAISATNAIGCTVGGGTVTAPNKSLGTP